jgi:glycosyltransferase involved in cell wall biosynthesis
MTDGPSLTYSVVTPARDEAENLQRLAASLVEQTLCPTAWVVVDDGSSDGTHELARTLEFDHPWVRAIAAPRRDERASGRLLGREVVAFMAGVEALPERTDVIVKVDADVSLGPRYFERLLACFEADPALGIASGLAYELEHGEWRPQPTTGAHARGAARAYRRACLDDVLPLEEHIGWDGVDELKAAARGWRTGTIRDLAFYHHRPMASRDGRVRGWMVQGRAAHYLGYRPSYVLLRALHRARRDPAALAMAGSYAAAHLRGDPTCRDPRVRSELRRLQRWRELPARLREASGRG